MGRLRAHAEIDWSGWGGEVRGSGGTLVAPTATQVELGGPGGGTNPEELLAAAHANCFTSTITSMARARSIELDRVETGATTELVWEDGRGDHRLASSQLTVRIESPAPREQIEQLVRDAEEDCPVCRALRGNVDVSVELVD
jgi:osmotically inducible protein OsmC